LNLLSIFFIIPLEVYKFIDFFIDLHHTDSKNIFLTKNYQLNQSTDFGYIAYAYQLWYKLCKTTDR